MNRSGVIPVPKKKKVSDAVSALLESGSVSSSDWRPYVWKNELSDQRDRIVRHLSEITSCARTEHNPHHMPERAIGIYLTAYW